MEVISRRMMRPSVRSRISVHVATLLGLALAAGAGITSAHADSSYPVAADRIHQTLVLSEVHPWAETPEVGGEWQRWDFPGRDPANNDIVSMFWPARGLYSASSPKHAATVGDDLGRAGVNAAVITWPNFYPNEQERVENLLQNMGKRTIIQVEPTWDQPPSLTDVQARVNTVLGYAKQRERFPNYYRDPKTGRPVVFVWDPGQVGLVGQWNEFISRHKAEAAKPPIFVAGLGWGTPIDWCRDSLFDGCMMAAHKTSTSDQGSIEWVLWKLHGEKGSRGQFLVAWSVPGFDFRPHCFANNPVVDREDGAVFDQKWAGVMNASWNGHRVSHAYTMYNNDGESAGIEPASNNPPVRGPGYVTCDGRVPPNYETYGEREPTYYLDRNGYWAGKFRSSRLGATAHR